MNVPLRAGSANSGCWPISVANSPHRFQRVAVRSQLVSDGAHHCLNHVAGGRFLSISPDRLD